MPYRILYRLPPLDLCDAKREPGRVVVITGDISGSDRTGVRLCDRDDRCFLHMCLLLLGEARTSPDRHDTDDVFPHGSSHPEIRLGSYFNSGIFYRVGTRHLCFVFVFFWFWFWFLVWVLLCFPTFLTSLMFKKLHPPEWFVCVLRLKRKVQIPENYRKPR